MEDLKVELPVLYLRLVDKPTFVGKLPDGSVVRILRTNKNQKVLGSKGINGSIIQDTGDASKTLDHILTKNNVASQITKIFAHLDEDIPLDISDNYTFIKRALPKFQPELNAKVKIDERLPTLVALNF